MTSPSRAEPGNVSLIYRLFGSLRHRNFRLLWIGNLATQASYWMFSVGLGWLIIQLETTNRAAWLAVLGFASGIPLLLFSLVGGVLADRFERRRLLLIYQAANLIFITVFAALVALGHIQTWQVLTIAFLFGVTQALNIPLRQSLVPALVDRSDLLNATALTSAAWNGMRIVGPALAGLLIATVDTKGIFLLMIPAYVWAMLWVVQMDIPPRPSHYRTAHPLRNLVDGLQFIRRDATIMTLIFTVTVPTLFAMPYLQFVPLFASDILKVGPQGLGMMEGAVGLGALIAALAVAGLGGMSHKGMWMVVVMAAFCGLVALFGLSLDFRVSLGLLSLSGIAWSVLNALNSTLLQLATPDEYRGRVFSVYALTWGMQPMGNLLMGGLAETLHSPPHAIAIIAGLGMLLTLTLAVLNPRMRRME